MEYWALVGVCNGDIIFWLVGGGLIIGLLLGVVVQRTQYFVWLLQSVMSSAWVISDTPMPM